MPKMKVEKNPAAGYGQIDVCHCHLVRFLGQMAGEVQMSGWQKGKAVPAGPGDPGQQTGSAKMKNDEEG